MTHMTQNSCEAYSRQYAQFVAKEVVKASTAHIFDSLRAALADHFKNNPTPGCEPQAAKVMEILSDVECAYYNEFNLQEAFEEVLER